MTLLLGILVVVFLVLAAFDVNPPRVNLGWLGLGIWAALVLLV